MDPIWAPHVIQNLKDSDLGLYIEFSYTACIPGGGCNVDRALQVLYQSNGDIKQATESLLTSSAHSFWTDEEVHHFEKLILDHGKNFFYISRDIKTKSVKQCVEFYYTWKKSSFRNQTNYHLAANSTTMTTSTTTASSSNGSINTSPSTPALANDEEFPCKVCGRIFAKIKSRSAHMKRHKNERSQQ